MIGFSAVQVEELNNKIRCDICGEIAIYEGIYGQIGEYIICKGCKSLICETCLKGTVTCPECGMKLFGGDS